MLYKKEDDKRFDTSSTLDNDVNLGLGGDIALRYRASKHVDLQLKSGVAWIANNNFDGVVTCCTSKYNWQANLSVGVVWKVGNNKKERELDVRCSLFRGPGNTSRERGDTPGGEGGAKPVVKQEEKTIENVVKVEAVEETFPELPTIHFKRNLAVIDTARYAGELFSVSWRR